MAMVTDFNPITCISPAVFAAVLEMLRIALDSTIRIESPETFNHIAPESFSWFFNTVLPERSAASKCRARRLGTPPTLIAGSIRRATNRGSHESWDGGGKNVAEALENLRDARPS
jgi:hypothetical protein